MFSWLRAEMPGPVTVVDDASHPLLRYAHCDGSVDPITGIARDLTARGAPALPPGAVACMTTAWGLHTGAPTLVLDIAGDGVPDPGTRRFALDLHDCEVVTIGGVRCTTLVRTVFDLARLAPLDLAAQALLDVRAILPVAEFDALLDAHGAEPGVDRARRLSSVVWPTAASCCR